MERTKAHAAVTIFAAIRACWTNETSAVPEEWHVENRARGQCDASSFVAWEYLGGELVLGQVFIDGVHTEHHYWNRIAGRDYDTTRDQFAGGEGVIEVAVLDEAYLMKHRAAMKPDLARRIELLRARVSARLRQL